MGNSAELESEKVAKISDASSYFNNLSLQEGVRILAGADNYLRSPAWLFPDKTEIPSLAWEFDISSLYCFMY